MNIPIPSSYKIIIRYFVFTFYNFYTRNLSYVDMPIINRQNASDEDMLYELYSLDFLKYVMDMLNGLKSGLEVLLPQTDPIRDKKVLVFRYEIVGRFCQFAESLGALILGYNKLNLTSNTQLNNNHAVNVLKTLSSYTIKEVDALYEKIQTNPLDYNILFGYDMLGNEYEMKVSLSLRNIKESLREISGCYRFFKESYNAYKHGYRLWVRKESSVEAAIFKNKKGNEDHIPLDDGSIELVMKAGKYCLNIFDLIKNNHKSIFDYLRNPQTERIMMKFLSDKNLRPEQIICKT
jgi:hypothetical protein